MELILRHEHASLASCWRPRWAFEWCSSSSFCGARRGVTHGKCRVQKSCQIWKNHRSVDDQWQATVRVTWLAPRKFRQSRIDFSRQHDQKKRNARIKPRSRASVFAAVSSRTVGWERSGKPCRKAVEVIWRFLKTFLIKIAFRKIDQQKAAEEEKGEFTIPSHSRLQSRRYGRTKPGAIRRRFSSTSTNGEVGKGT